MHKPPDRPTPRDDDRAPVVLGIDAATPPASVAIVRGAVPLASETGPFGRHTDAWILPAIDALLARAGCALRELDAIAASVGPGTFTGIRVGIATAQGLGHGSGVRVAGISTLSALARLVSDQGPATVLATIDARRGQVYAALAERREDDVELIREPWLATPDELLAALPELGSPPLTGTGTGADPRLAELAGAATEDWPVATGVALLAARRLGDTGAADLPPAVPFYIRDPDARPGRNPLAGGRPSRPPQT